MNSHPHLVFLVPTFEGSEPRAIRARQLIPFLSKDFSVTVVCLHAGLKSVQLTSTPDYSLLRVPYSFVSRYITLRRYSDVIPNVVLLKVLRPLSYLIRRFMLFPDAWVVEHRRLVHALQSLDNPPDIIVSSMMPFSMATVAAEYKRIWQGDKKVYQVCDIGDPLSFNAAQVANVVQHRNQKLIRFEQKALQSADHVIVTNEETLSHYKNSFQVPESKLSCIPQGSSFAKMPVQKDRAIQQGLIKIFYGGSFTSQVRDPATLFSVLSQYTSSVQMKVCGTNGINFTSGNEHILFQEAIPYEEMYSQYTETDCALYFENDSGMQTSGKIFELLTLRIPIVFLYKNEASQTKRQCEPYGHIIFVRNNELELHNVFKNLESLYSTALAWLDSEAGDFSTEQFSWEDRAEKFKLALSKLD